MSTQQRIATCMAVLAIWVTAPDLEFAGTAARLHAGECVTGCVNGCPSCGRGRYASSARRNQGFWDDVSDSWDRTVERCGDGMESLRLKWYMHHHSTHHTLYPEFPPHWSPTYGYYETCWRPFPYMCPRCPPPALFAPTTHAVYGDPVLPPSGPDQAPVEPPPVEPAEPPSAPPSEPAPADPIEAEPEPPAMSLRREPAVSRIQAEPVAPSPTTLEEWLEDDRPVFLPLIRPLSNEQGF